MPWFGRPRSFADLSGNKIYLRPCLDANDKIVALEIAATALGRIQTTIEHAALIQEWVGRDNAEWREADIQDGYKTPKIPSADRHRATPEGAKAVDDAAVRDNDRLKSLHPFPADDVCPDPQPTLTISARKYFKAEVALSTRHSALYVRDQQGEALSINNVETKQMLFGLFGSQAINAFRDFLVSATAPQHTATEAGEIQHQKEANLRHRMETQANAIVENWFNAHITRRKKGSHIERELKHKIFAAMLWARNMVE